MKSAFTLIEMLVVIALAAILATIVTVSLAGSYRAARAEDVAGQIATFDRMVREHARRFGKLDRLIFDLDRGTVTRASDDANADARGGSLHLPGGFQIGRLLTVGGSAMSGQVTIDCSPNGQTPSYATLLLDLDQKPHWIITAGLTGKTITARDEREVQDVFAAVQVRDAQ